MTTDEEHTLIRMMREHMDESARWRLSVGDRMQVIEDEQRTMREELQRNTEVTQSVRDTYTAGRVATRVIKWIGGIAIAVGSFWWAMKEVLGYHSGIGPTP